MQETLAHTERLAGKVLAGGENEGLDGLGEVRAAWVDVGRGIEVAQTIPVYPSY